MQHMFQLALLRLLTIFGYYDFFWTFWISDSPEWIFGIPVSAYLLGTSD